MRKEEFLNILDRKLQVINEKERRDIIDEYRTHIEMKVADGKSEEEAIDDFGDLDELVDEILDAYKINTDRVNQSFDRKFNNFMDELYDGFKRFLGSFTSLEVDDVVKLIFEILIIFLILGILYIPFSIIGSIGSSLLRNVIGFGIGYVLAGIWKVVIELVYVVVFICVVVNVVTKRIRRYRDGEYNNQNSSVFDDFKDSFHFEQTKDNLHSTMNDNTNKRKSKTYEYRSNTYSQATNGKKKATSKEDVEEDLEDVKQDFCEEQEAFRTEDAKNYEETYQERRKKGYESREDRIQKRDATSQVNEGIRTVLRTLMRTFYCLLLIPFIGVIVALCCALGAMIVFTLQGFTLFGAYFLVIGGLFVSGSFLSLLHSVLWRGR